MKQPESPHLSNTVHPNLILTALAIGYVLSLLDATIVNISLASLRASFHVDLATVSWVVNSYGIVFAVLLIVVGRLADQFGRKRVFLLGVVLFGLSSLLCGSAPSLGWLLGFRALQGVGAAILTAVSLAILLVVVPGEHRGAAIGLWGAFSGIAAAVGPVVGGFLVQYLSWHWIFWVNIPFCLLSLFLVARYVPETRDAQDSTALDLPGIALLMGGLLCLVLVIGQGWTTPTTLALGGGGITAFLLFISVERRQAMPVVDFSLFRHRSFTSANLLIFLFGIAIQAAFVLLPLYFLTIQEKTQVQAAYAVIPIPVSGCVASALYSRFSRRLNTHLVACIGLTLVVLGFGSVSLLSPTSPVFETTWREILLGCGTGLCFSCFSAIALSNIPRTQAGVGSGLFTTSQQIGLALGVSLFIRIVSVPSTIRLAVHIAAFHLSWLVAMCSAAVATGLFLVLSLLQHHYGGTFLQRRDAHRTQAHVHKRSATQGEQREGRGMSEKKVPVEITASALAALTVYLSLLQIPTWATFVSWAGVFLLQEKSLREAIRKTWPPLLLGVVAGVCAHLATPFPLGRLPQGTVLTATYGALITFCIALGVLFLGRVPHFTAIAFSFFSFACLEKQAETQTLWLAAPSILLATFLGAPLAWSSIALMGAYPLWKNLWLWFPCIRHEASRLIITFHSFSAQQTPSRSENGLRWVAVENDLFALLQSRLQIERRSLEHSAPLLAFVPNTRELDVLQEAIQRKFHLPTTNDLFVSAKTFESLVSHILTHQGMHETVSREEKTG